MAGGVVLSAGVSAASAASLSAQDVQIIGRAVAFMQPPPGSGAVAVVYSAADPASRRDAEAIASAIGDGITIDGTRRPGRLVEADALRSGQFAIAIAAAGANGPLLGAAVRAAHVLCVTADLAAVQAGFCAMAVSTGLRVQIVLNHAAAAASDVTFAPAFRMMIREM